MPKEHFFSNQQIADLLRKVATAYQIKDENRFRIAAYEAAAAAIEHSTVELKDLWDERRLKEVPGVGESLAGHLDELFRTGRVKHFETVFKDLPPAMFVFEKIPGVGPKKAYRLSDELGIKEEKYAVERLKKAALSGKVSKLEGFGKKSEEELLKGIEAFKKGEVKTQRMPLFLASELASDLIDYLKESPVVIEAHSLGSLRRRLVTIGDIDISVSTNDPKKALEHFFNYPKIKRVVSRGEEALGRAVLRTGQQVDIRVSRPESYGAMLQYFTGSKQHNINLREYALGKKLSLSEYGIKDLRNNRLIKTKTEEDFYQRLGMDWIPPEIREGTEEIEAALRRARGKPGGLPNLVELGDIKGDLHLHSNFPIEPSHDLGASSVEDMIKLAEGLNYQYLGFSEHNPAISRNSPTQVTEILKRKRFFFDQVIYSYEQSAKQRGIKLPIRIFNGLEIDIKPNGDLAVSDEGLALLDYAIVSIHSSFDLDRQKMTDRVIKALSHPKARIFGHPTGRKVGEREGYELDWERLFDFCLKKEKILEISAWPNRMDLPDFLVREAVKNGVKMVINTDSHEVSQMWLMEYGVSVARRGWTQKADILNTLPAEEFNDILLLKK
jgi:DNA polymerase (family 10)